MDKQAKAGYMMTLEDASKFWTHCKEAEDALGEKLTQEEREKLLVSMRLGTEISLEELLDTMKGKRTLVIKEKNNASND